MPYMLSGDQILAGIYIIDHPGYIDNMRRITGLVCSNAKIVRMSTIPRWPWNKHRSDFQIADSTKSYQLHSLKDHRKTMP